MPNTHRITLNANRRYLISGLISLASFLGLRYRRALDANFQRIFNKIIFDLIFDIIYAMSYFLDRCQLLPMFWPCSFYVKKISLKIERRKQNDLFLYFASSSSDCVVNFSCFYFSINTKSKIFLGYNQLLFIFTLKNVRFLAILFIINYVFHYKIQFSLYILCNYLNNVLQLLLLYNIIHIWKKEKK